jgi:RNA polymerase sigma-70 factor (ECF subfamily)
MRATLVVGRPSIAACGLSAAEQEESHDIAKAYRSYGPGVWRFMARLGVPEQELEDALQDVFVVAHQRLSTFRGASKFKTWIYGIAFHLAKRRLAQARRLQAKSEVEIEHASVVGDPLQQLLVKSDLSRLDFILSGLVQGQREVFVLYEIEGFTALEISETLGLKLFTVFSRLRLARRAFDRTLQTHSRESANEEP